MLSDIVFNDQQTAVVVTVILYNAAQLFDTFRSGAH